MPLRKDLYQDMKKYRKTIRKQQERYRKRTGSGQFESRRWTKEESQRVLAHQVPDRQLAKELGRSVGSIHSQRSRLKKGGK